MPWTHWKFFIFAVGPWCSKAGCLTSGPLLLVSNPATAPLLSALFGQRLLSASARNSPPAGRKGRSAAGVQWDLVYKSASNPLGPSVSWRTAVTLPVSLHLCRRNQANPLGRGVWHGSCALLHLSPFLQLFFFIERQGPSPTDGAELHPTPNFRRVSSPCMERPIHFV